MRCFAARRLHSKVADWDVFAFAPAFYNRLLFRIFRVWPWERECIVGVMPLRVDEAENTILVGVMPLRVDEACRMGHHAQNTHWHELCFLLCSVSHWIPQLLIGDNAYWCCNTRRCQGHKFSTQNFTWENQRWYKIINHSGGVKCCAVRNVLIAGVHHMGVAALSQLSATPRAKILFSTRVVPISSAWEWSQWTEGPQVIACWAALCWN